MAETKMKAKNNRTFQLKELWLFSAMFMIAFACAFVYLLPFGNMALLSIKDTDQQVAGATGSVLPLDTVQFEYEGDSYDIYNVPLVEGDEETIEMALVQKGRRVSQLVDINDPEAGLVEWEGNWRGLAPVTVLNPKWENFEEAWTGISFPRVFGNTLYIALVSMVGTIISSLFVGYAFARFPIPGKNILFIILIGTIILPQQVTLIPTFAFFTTLTNFLEDSITGIGIPSLVYNPLVAVIAWLPLTLPHFFSNAFNVFLFRQYFMTLPKELDEAAMIDGAGPLRILWQIIIPLSWPVIIAVGLFHFIFSWNDYFAPLIYLINKRELLPISVAVQVFNFQYGSRPELVQATSLMAMILPIAIFFFTQRIFMKGVVLTGVDK